MARKSLKSTASISDRMRRVRSDGTEPELLLRHALSKRGLRFRVCDRTLPGKPDLVLAKHRVAIFVDGEFWHGAQWQTRDLACIEDQFTATSSKDYWTRKIRRNMERDIESTSQLLLEGWKVLRFWEADIRARADECVTTVERTILEDRVPRDIIERLLGRTVLEFFAGIGLMRMGLEKSGWRTVFANDIDPAKKEMYEAQFDDGANGLYLLEDVNSLDASKIPAATLATASFPCTDLSLAGARRGLQGKHSSAFWGFTNCLRLMQEKRPAIVLIENVPGFLSSHNGNDFRDALRMLNDLGYAVDAFILDALNFVPQSRQRLFVIGIRENLDVVHQVAEEPLFYQSAVRPAVLADFIFQSPDIRWRVRDLPPPPVLSIELKEILEDFPDAAPEWWSEDRADYLLSQMSERHKKLACEMMKKRVWAYGTVFRRIRNGVSTAELRCDGIAGCLRTPKGGSARQILFKAGYGRYKARLLTPRECARLMGAGDFRITVKGNQALFGFGDAVCVPAVDWISKYYLNPVLNELIRCRPGSTPAYAS